MGLVTHAHLLSHPLLAETLVLLVSEAILFQDVGVLGETSKVATMLAWMFLSVATAALGPRSCLGMVLVRCFVVGCHVVGVVASVAMRLTGGGFTVGLHGSPIVVNIDGLLLEQGGEVGDLIGDSIGGAGDWRRGFIEFALAIIVGEFLQDGGDSAAGVGIVVGVGAAYGLEGGTEFLTHKLCWL